MVLAIGAGGALAIVRESRLTVETIGAWEIPAISYSKRSSQKTSGSSYWGSPERKEHYLPLIKDAAERHGADAEQMMAVAICESGLNPEALNKNDPGTGSKGLFQFQDGTFYGHAAQMGIDLPDIWNDTQQIELAAWMFGRGLQFHWTCARMIGIIK